MACPKKKRREVKISTYRSGVATMAIAMVTGEKPIRASRPATRRESISVGGVGRER
jgi:hypothetical protein